MGRFKPGNKGLSPGLVSDLIPALPGEPCPPAAHEDGEPALSAEAGERNGGGEAEETEVPALLQGGREAFKARCCN